MRPARFGASGHARVGRPLSAPSPQGPWSPRLVHPMAPYLLRGPCPVGATRHHAHRGPSRDRYGLGHQHLSWLGLRHSPQVSKQLSDGPLADPVRLPGHRLPRSRILAGQHRARLACRSSPGRIAFSQRAMQGSRRCRDPKVRWWRVAAMSKYAVFFTLKGEAIAQAMEQPSDRVTVVSKAVESAGGTLEAYYLMFGQYDGFVIVDLPDSRAAAATSLAVSSTGAFEHLETHELIEAEDLNPILEQAKGITSQLPGT